MVAIVSGESLGLNLTSLRTLGPQDFTGVATHGRSGERAYVNVATGNLVVQDLEGYAAAKGEDYAALRTYNSQGVLDEDGDAWINGTVARPLQVVGELNAAGSAIRRTDSDGSVAVYSFVSAAEGYVTTDGDGAHDTIRLEGARLVWKDGSTGVTQHYEATGSFRLLETRDAGGSNTLTYHYGAGRLAAVTAAGGDGTFYDYAGGKLAQVETRRAGGAVTSRVTYTHESNRMSVRVDLTPEDSTDAKVYTTTYTYSPTGRIVTIGQTDGTQLTFTYETVGATDRIKSVSDALNHQTRFDYVSNSDGSMTTRVTDPLGFVTVYESDVRGQLVGIRAPSLAANPPGRTFSYDEDGNVDRIADEKGRATTYRYDPRGNLIEQKDGGGNTVTRKFDLDNQLIAETEWLQPDPDGIGEAGPSHARTTRYVYEEGGRHLLRFVISPEGRVTEHRYDGFGLRRSSITYLGDTYQTSETSVEGWASTQNPAKTQLVEFDYDALGQLRLRTTFAQVTIDGVGVVAGQTREKFEFDQAGHLLLSTSGTGDVTTYAYDGLGRLRSSTNALGETTVTEYDDAGRRTEVKMAHGLVSTSRYDVANRLFAVVRSDATAAALGTTRYEYDANDRLRMVKDPTGVRHWMLYDGAGRKTADIDGNGTLTEFQHDAAGLLTCTVEYATAVDTASLVDAEGKPLPALTVAEIRPGGNGSANRTWRAYDDAGRLVRTATTAGLKIAVTETQYDGASRVVRTVQYATLLNDDRTLVSPGSIIAPAKAADDRVTRYFYTPDGQQAGVLDAEGYLTVHSYDAGGRRVQSVAYANATATAGDLRESGSITQLVPVKDDTADVYTHWLYDGQGRLVGEVDGERYLTETSYDAAGRVKSSMRYATAVTAVVTPDSSLDDIRRGVGDDRNRLATRAYDALGRVTLETNHEGTRTSYDYDTAGNLVKSVRALGTDEARISLNRYDSQGRLTAQLSAEGGRQLLANMTADEVEAIWTAYATTHHYDDAGRRISTTDPLKNRILFFYDEDGALRYQVNARGEVQESRYDDRGRLSETISYVGRIDLTGLTGGLAIGPVSSRLAAIADAEVDSRITFAYHREGKLATRTDAVGNRTHISYNAFGDVVRTEQENAASGSLVTTQVVDHRGLVTKTIADPGVIEATRETVYDAFGRATLSVDANGNERRRAFDRLGRIVETTNGTGAVGKSTYDAFAQVLTHHDHLGAKTTYEYDSALRKLTVTTPEGIRTATAYTRHGQVLSITDGLENTTHYTYDRDGNLAQTSTPLTTSRSEYDAAGLLRDTWDANGNRVHYDYDAANRVLTRTVNPAGLKLATTYTYDGIGQQVRVEDPQGGVTGIGYDRAGRMLQQTVDPEGLKLTTKYTYDAAGRVLTVESPGSSVTQYVYDVLGRRKQEIVDPQTLENPEGLHLKRSWTYDDQGNAVSSTDARGNTTLYAYDAENRLVFTIDPLGGTVKVSYDDEGRVIRTARLAECLDVSALGAAPTIAQIQQQIQAQIEAATGTPRAPDQVEHRVYDRDGRLVATVDGMGAVVKYVLDGNGRVTSRTAYATRIEMGAWVRGTDPTVAVDAKHDARERTIYDPLGRAVYVLDGTRALTALSYDGNGNVQARTAFANTVPPETGFSQAAMAAAAEAIADSKRDSALRNVYDAAGRLTWSVDGTGAVTRRVWDANGNLVRHIAYASPLPQGADVQATLPSAADRVTSMAYDAANRLVFTVDAMNTVTENLLDRDGRVVRSIAYATPLDAIPAPGRPDTADNIRSALTVKALEDRSMRFGYDAVGRQVLEVDAMRAATETRYDDAGNVVSRIDYANLLEGALSRAADLDELKTLMRADASADRRTRYSYDAAGQLTYTIDATNAVQKREYDGAGRLTTVTRYATRVLVGENTSVANMALKVTQDSADQRETHKYDAAGRLVSSTDALGFTESFGYDAIGRKVSFTNKKGDTWTYIHDAAGRLTEERSPLAVLASMGGADLMGVSAANDYVVTSMTYDALGNLISRTEAEGRPEERTTTYGYDAAGRQTLVTLGSAQVYHAGSDLLDTFSVARSERSETLQVQTFYDAVGNAVANIDAGGALTQKTHDAAGRVLYEVDAVGYVTGYHRNAFGEVTVLTRYATGTSLETRSVARANDAVTTSVVDEALSAVGVDHSKDRTLTSTYDRAGRVTRVQELSADTFDTTAAADLQWRAGRKTTDTRYNAFGEAVEVRSLRNAATDDWSSVSRFFDASGRERASVDATGYVSERAYDAFGNLVSLKEYANSVKAGWTTAGYTRGASSADDRTTEYEYDKGNRKVLERRRAVEYSAAADGTSIRGDLVTAYDYDAVGNQVAVTTAHGRTRTYYDALGRVSAVLQPQSSVVTPDGGDLSVLVNPLTTFLRDAHGNVLRELRHANGATVTAAGYTAGAASSADRMIRTRYDRLGRAVQVLDARGHQQFFSYDAYGKVAKKWQPVEDGTGRVTYEVNTYNRLGQLVSVRRPGTTMQVQGGITARWITVPTATTPFSAPPPGGEVELGWTGLEGARVRVEVTYTTPAYSLTTTGGTESEGPKTTDYPARTVTVTQEKTAAQAPAGLTVVFEEAVAKINTIRVWELKGTTWEIRWEGSYAQAQGTGVVEVDQNTVEETVATMRYNAFGEVVARIADGALAEYFHYDAAGRLWRTNSGDGVDKIFLYDAQGNRTSEIRSPGDARGNVDLQLLASAEEAHLDVHNRRTDFTYDAAGRLVRKTDAARLETQGGLSVRQMVATSTVLDAGQPIPFELESGWRFEPGTAKVKLTWTNLTVLGSGDVKVRVSYQTASSELGEGGAAVLDSDVFASHEAAQGVTLSWATKPIASITEITVWKKNGIGVWTEVIKQAPGTTTHQIDLDAASNRWAAEYLEYRVAGSTGDYIRATLTDFGDRAVWAGLATLGAGTYEYRLGITPQGQEERQFGTGTFTIAANRTVTVQTTDNTGGVWQRPVIQQKTDRWGNVVELSDPRSADWKTVYAYNANNQMVMQRLPTAGGIQSSSSPSTRIYYDELGRQVAVRDARGYVNATVYGASGNLVREERPDLGVVTHRYNAFGEKVATTDGRGNVQSFSYDKGGNLIGVNKGTAPVHAVDANLQLLAPVTRAIEERWTYDALGRRLAHFNGENQKTTYRYDLLGNVIEVVQPMGQKTYAAYDAQGHKIAEVDANGYEATWRYDYFGKLLAHTDIGGAKYQYTYDNARQLLKQTNSREQQLAYKYDAAGQVTEIRDTQTGYAVKVTTYVYDLGGRRLVEKTVIGAEVHQDNRLAYDAQGKLRDISDTRVRMQLAYDANGNRTSVSTTVRYAGLNGEVLHKTSRYFQYDEMNRQIVVDAVDAAGAMDENTHKLKYDENGNRTSDTYLGYAVVRDAAGDWTVREVLDLVKETYAYDNLNRLSEIRRDDRIIDNRGYDAVDRVITSGAFLSNAYLDQLQRLVMAGHAVRQDVRVNRYDANGRMLHQTVKSADGKLMQEISWDPTEPAREVSTSLADAYRAEGYDHAGNVKGYTVFTHEGSKTAKYSTTLERFEGYVGTDGTVTDSSTGETGANKQVYDANGHLVRVDDNHLTGNERSFVNDAQGRALSTVRGGHVQRQLIVNGEVMGRYGVGVHERVATDADGYPNFTDVADFNFSFASVTPTHPAPSPGAYIVRAGDTLQTIARGAYGDAALWYLIAQANGLSSNDDVRVGQVLNIPNRVGTIHNNEGTFKPYDPSRITGDLAPSLPLPGPEGCGAAGQILMVIVAIVVTIYTAGAAAAAMSTAASTTATTVGYAAAGTAAMSGTYGAAVGMAAAAVGGAAGSIASQVVGLATGTIDEFSWKNVALSAIGGGVSAGLGGWAPLGGQASSIGNVMVRAAVGNAIGQGIGVATGLQKSFDWRGVAASAVGAGVGQAVGGAMGMNDPGFKNLSFGEQFGARLVTGLAASAATAVMRGGKIAIQQVAVDAFGNALGSSLADSVGQGSSTSAQQGDPLGEFIDKNMPAWEQRQANFDQVRQAFGNPGVEPGAGVVIAGAGYTGGLGGASSPSISQRAAMQRGFGPLTDDAARARLFDELGGPWLGGASRSSIPATDNSAVIDYGDVLTSMNGGTPGAAAFATGLTAAQFGQSMIDMYIKSPINLVPGIVSEVVNGYTGIGNLIAGNGPQVGTLNLRPLKYSDPMAGALGEFGASIVLPGGVAKTADIAADVRGVSVMDNATLGAMPGYARQTRAAPRSVELAPHLQAEAKGYKGVKVTENGGPTFANTEYLYPVESGQSNIVEIMMTGSRRLDFEQANKLANLTNAVPKGFSAPKGYIWHHVDDFDPFIGQSTVQLVRADAHIAINPHAGSVRQYESYYRTKYR